MATLFFYIGVGFLGIVNFLFSIFSIIIPSQIITSLIKLFSLLGYFNGLFPMSDFVAALLFILSVWLGMYGVRIILFFLSLIPIIGKKVELPSMHQSKKK